MITLQEAVKIAKNNKKNFWLDGLLFYGIVEYTDRFVFDYCLESGEPLAGIASLYVKKDTGEVDYFFPPDYDIDYLNSGVEVQGYGLDKEAREALERKYLEQLKGMCVNDVDDISE